MQWFLGDWLHCSSLWCSESKLHLSPVPLFDAETWVVCCFVQELQQLKETIAVRMRPVCLAGSPFLSLISRHSTLKASLFHIPLSSKLSFFFFSADVAVSVPHVPAMHLVSPLRRIIAVAAMPLPSGATSWMRTWPRWTSFILHAMTR